MKILYGFPLAGLWFLWNTWPKIKNSWLFKKTTWSVKDYEEQMKKYNYKEKRKWFQ